MHRQRGRIAPYCQAAAALAAHQRLQHHQLAHCCPELVLQVPARPAQQTLGSMIQVPKVC